MTAALHTVHVRVNDATTGRPTPVRLRLNDAEGTYYPPLGRLIPFATGRGQDMGGSLLQDGKEYAFVDGACEVPLPAGPIRAELRKGPEYTPQSVGMQLAAGRLALRLSIDRWINLRDQGWYAGDTRCHYLSPAAALLEAGAEDLAVVNLLAFADRLADGEVPALPNILDYSGQKPALQIPGHMVVANTHNRHPVLGSLGLLNTHRVVYPLAFGEPAGVDDWTLRDWCGQCHRKGGLVIWTRPGPPGCPLGEPLADLILGDVDAFEMAFCENGLLDGLADWYDLLNCGLRVPLVGASGKESNCVPLGALRTYARLKPGEEFSYKAWIEAVRRGDTFVTNGPLLSLSADWVAPGQVVAVRAHARSIVPFEHLELIANGRVIASAARSGEPGTAIIETEVPMTADGWLAARCGGGHAFAHTSPVYFLVPGAKPRVDAAALQRLIGELDRMLEWVAREARCPTEKHRAALTAVFTAARAQLQRRIF